MKDTQTKGLPQYRPDGSIYYVSAMHRNVRLKKKKNFKNLKKKTLKT